MEAGVDTEAILTDLLLKVCSAAYLIIPRATSPEGASFLVGRLTYINHQ